MDFWIYFPTRQVANQAQIHFLVFYNQSNFFSGLLASISQNYARKYGTSIDQLEFKYDLQNNIVAEEQFDINLLFDENNEDRFKIPSAQDGILLCGFYLDGAIWDRNSETLLDSPQRLTQLPYFLCKLVKVKKAFLLF